MDKKRLIVGISGASGAPVAVSLLKALRQMPDIEAHLVITESGRRTITEETGLAVQQVYSLADVIYDEKDTGAGPASGTFRTMGMIVVPCSMKTAAGIHSGYTDNLLLRAADVTLKERRKLVLVPRECPLSPVHLRNLYELALYGAVILPPVLAFYNHPESIEDTVKTVVGKILDCFDLPYQDFKRWE
jgi:polyprenyl P-hydroxybenzoate and phenylacrylic acid decarboxylases